jgi:hypothetical protein
LIQVHVLLVRQILCLPDEIICGRRHTLELQIDTPSHAPGRELHKQLTDPQTPMQMVSGQ